MVRRAQVLPLLAATTILAVGAPAAAHPGGAVPTTVTLRSGAAASATLAEDDLPLEVTITSLSPSVVPARGKLRISGTVSNVSDETYDEIRVYGLTSTTPLTTRAELAEAAQSDPAIEVGDRITNVADDLDSLDPGETASYTLKIPRDLLPVGVTSQPGVYWLGVHALGATTAGRDQVADGKARTFLPLAPDDVAPIDAALVMSIRHPVEYRADGSLRGVSAWRTDLAPGGSLQELVASGVLTVFDAGTEPVWRIAPEQHLVAAFYRNTVIHMLVERAIGEVSLLDAIAAPEGADVERAAWERAKALRDLLKFEFFFPGRDDFERELRAELALMSPISPAEPGVLTSAAARAILDATDLHVAHLVLRPFVDAYLVVADRLAAAGDSAVAEEDILDEALRVGQQWELERRIASAESVSLELYKTALRLARHRGLLGGEGGDTAYEGESLSARRAAFLVELQGVATQLDQIDRIEQARRSARGVR